MRVLVIANLCNDMNKSSVIGFRLLNEETLEIADVPTDGVKGTMAKGNVEFLNIALINNQITGTNGSLNRYAYIDRVSNVLVGTEASPLVVISKIGEVGYFVADAFGKTAKIRTDKAVEYSNNFGIANGKVVEKDGLEFISSISGNYEVKEVSPSKVKNTRININIPIGVKDAQSAAKHVGEEVDYEMNSNDVFKCMNNGQKELLKQYYMWYTVKVYKSFAKNIRLKLAVSKVEKLAALRGNSEWQFAGVWDTGFTGGGHCELGHALRYEFYAEPVEESEKNAEHRYSRFNRHRLSGQKSVEELRDNCIIFGERCAGDFFDISPEDMKKLVRTREIMSNEIEFLVDTVTNHKEEEMFGRVQLLTDIVDRLATNDVNLKTVFGTNVGEILIQFRKMNLPYPMSLVMMASENFRKTFKQSIDLILPSNKNVCNVIKTLNTSLNTGVHISGLLNLVEFMMTNSIEGKYQYNALDDSVVKRKDVGSYNEKSRKERRMVEYRIKSTNFGSLGNNLSDFDKLASIIEFYLEAFSDIRNRASNKILTSEQAKAILYKIDNENSISSRARSVYLQRSADASNEYTSITENKDKAEYIISQMLMEVSRKYRESDEFIYRESSDRKEDIENKELKLGMISNLLLCSIYRSVSYSNSWKAKESTSYYNRFVSIDMAINDIQNNFKEPKEMSDLALEEIHRLIDKESESIRKRSYTIVDITDGSEEVIYDMTTNYELAKSEAIKAASKNVGNDKNEYRHIVVYLGYGTESQLINWDSERSSEVAEIRAAENNKSEEIVEEAVSNKDETKEDIKSTPNIKDGLLKTLSSLLEELKGKYDSEDYSFKVAIDIADRYDGDSKLSPKQRWRVEDTIKKLSKLRSSNSSESGSTEAESTEPTVKEEYGIEFRDDRASVADNEKVNTMLKVILKNKDNKDIQEAVLKVSTIAFSIAETVKKKGYISPKQMRHLDLAYNEIVKVLLAGE